MTRLGLFPSLVCLGLSLSLFGSLPQRTRAPALDSCRDAGSLVQLKSLVFHSLFRNSKERVGQRREGERAEEMQSEAELQNRRR